MAEVYTCSICGQSMPSERGIKIHTTRMHGDKVKPAPEPTPKRGDHLNENSVPTFAKIEQLPSLGIREILVGSLINVTNKARVWEVVENAPVLRVVENEIPCTVHQRYISNNTWMLYAMAFNSELPMLIFEADVLNGLHNLVRLGQASDTVPVIPVVEPLPPANEAIAEEIAQPIEEEKIKYLEAIAQYTDARDMKLETEKKYKDVDERTRETILKFVTQYGVETEEGKGDSRLKEGGFDVLYTFTPGATVIERDESKIVQWLCENGFMGCLKFSLDVAKWEKAKQMGQIPAEFIQTVEAPKKLPDARKLNVKRIDLDAPTE